MAGTPVAHRARRKSSVPWWRTLRGQERLVGYGFLLPDVIGLTIFVGLPIVGAFWISFHNWSLLGDATWTGFSNYRTAKDDPAFRDALKITAIYTFSFVPLLYVCSLGLALLVNQKLRFTGLFRMAYFLPFMFSLAISSVVWTLLLDERTGPFNVVLGWVGIPAQAWLGSERLALASVVAVTLWQSVGFGMIIFLAGLQDIPRSYYEAALVDGAGTWRRFTTITMPLLKPTTAFVLVISFIGALQVFDPIYIMTQGGPANSTTTAVFYIYQQGFKFLQFGYASALSVILFAIILVFTLVQLRVFRQEDLRG
jgi:multiple sugar transport system permease protein